MPKKFEEERGRLVDAYVDGHKYVFGKRVMIYGEEDLVLGMLGFCKEIGLEPVLIVLVVIAARCVIKPKIFPELELTLKVMDDCVSKPCVMLLQKLSLIS